MDKHSFNSAGVMDALRRFGSTHAMPALRSAGGYLKNEAQAIGSDLLHTIKNPSSLLPTKEQIIGQPGEFVRQFQNGELHKPNGLLRSAFKPRGKLDAAFMYGLPAYSLYQAAQAPEGHRAEAIGDVLGNFAGGMLGSPLGMVGNMAGSMGLGSLGRSIGHTIDQSGQKSIYGDTQGY
jgi:hypothetical protein